MKQRTITKKLCWISSLTAVAALAIVSTQFAEADDKAKEKGKGKAHSNKDLPSHADVQAALKQVVAGKDNAGFGLHMWATHSRQVRHSIAICHKDLRDLLSI